jgi:hypothetical protein
MVEAFSLHWVSRVEERAWFDAGVLEYKVRMPSTKNMRQRTDLAVVSINGPERNGSGKRSGRVGDREYQSGLGRGRFVSLVMGVC